MKEIASILCKIRLPENVAKALREELKKAKSNE